MGSKTYIPEELIDEGRSLVGTLIDSGQVSGFQTRATVSTWPFWDACWLTFLACASCPWG